MNDTLKVAGRIGAELGAAKAENDRLREALRWYEEKVAECRKIGSLGDNARQALDLDGGFRARDALSQQAEPTDTYTAVDMATAAAQGFRDGQAAMEPAPAQDERELPDYLNDAIDNLVHDNYERSQAGSRNRQADVDLIRAALATRPAQTEQQPVAVPEGWKLVPVQPTAEMLAAVTTSTFEPLRQEAMKMAREDYQAMLYAAPIAQTAPQVQSGWTSVEDRLPDPALHARVLIFTDGYDFAGEQYFDVKAESLNEHSFGDPGDQPEPYCKATHWMPLPAASAPQPEQSGKFAIGDRVKKTSGSEWEGHVCGWYSTNQTPEGYAVESEAHAGSVQIYPAKALEAVE